MSYKLQLWSTDADGIPNELHDEVDVAEDEWDYAQQDADAALLLIDNLKIGRLM